MISKGNPLVLNLPAIAKPAGPAPIIKTGVCSMVNAIFPNALLKVGKKLKRKHTKFSGCLLLKDHISCFFRDHHYRGVRIAAHDNGHHGGVDDPQARYAMHP